MNKIIKFLSLLLFINLSGCDFLDDVSEHIFNNLVTVSIICDEHSSVIGQSLKKVEFGGSAIFNLSFDDGYSFLSSSDGTFSQASSTLKVDDIKFSTNIYVSSGKTGSFTLTILNDKNFGSYSLFPQKLGYENGDVVTIKVNPNEGFNFLCYSWEDYCRTEFSKPCGNILSFDDSYEIKITDDTKIAINYFDQHSSYFIDYDLIGGTTLGGKSLIKTDCYKGAKQPYNGYTTFNIASYAYRDGYSLCGLNTSRDGTGETIGSGSRVDMDLFSSNHLVLYAQWVKETDVNDDAGNAIISKFIGHTNLRSLVIPNLIKGQKVVGIKENSFLGFTDLEKVYLNIDLNFVEKNAFVGLESLKELYFFSSLSEIYDESFNSETLTKVFINKNSLSRTWASGNLCFTYMYERAEMLSSTSEKPIVYFTGLSTILCNHDLTPFADKYDGQYNFMQFGANAGLSFQLILLTLKNVLRPQDIVVCPFYHTAIKKESTSSVNILNFQYDFDYLANFDYQQIKHSFFSTFVMASAQMEKNLFSEVITADNAVTSNNSKFAGYTNSSYSDDPQNGLDLPDRLSAVDYLDMSKYEYLVELIDSYCIDKSNFYITWNSYNKNCIRTEADYDSFLSFESMIRQNFSDCGFFDSIEENIYMGNYFLANDCVHLSQFGGNQRVARWVNELPL